MNDDELEQSLRELPEPTLPAEWRGSILKAVRANASADESGKDNWPAFLLRLMCLARDNRFTAGGLAALWLLILLLKTSTPVDRDAERLMAQAGSQPPPRFIPLREELQIADLLQEDFAPTPVRQP